MKPVRRTLVALASAAGLAGGGLALAAPAFADANAPSTWGCHAVHNIAEDTYAALCPDMPAGHQSALLITCKTAPGTFHNLRAEWSPYPWLGYGVSCRGIGVYTGSHSYRVL